MFFKGTGKTRTLVALIEEIIHSSNKSILVCANSNAACDEITSRLLRIFDNDTLFRLYAKSYNATNVSCEIKKYSNFKEQFHFPCLKYIYKFRIVVCTLSTAGCISRARYEDCDFQPNHFSHIIIDECASTNETTALVAIAGNFNFKKMKI